MRTKPKTDNSSISIDLQIRFIDRQSYRIDRIVLSTY